MNKFDILFSTASYYSAGYAIRLVKSLRYIPGRNVAIVTCARAEDADEIVEGLKDCDQERAIFLSALDSSYFCKNWGFLCAVMMGMLPKWFCTCDDDIEFYPYAAHIPERLMEAKRDYDFSLMAFRNPKQEYTSGILENDYRISPSWLDGNALFSGWTDNLAYGIPDSVPGEKITFFVELEYQHRMMLKTGRRMIADMRDYYYMHHFRADQALRDRRDPNDVAGMNAGSRLWALKYGLEVGDWNAPDTHARILQHVSRPDGFEKMKKMILYGVDNMDWKSAIRCANPFVKIVEDKIKW